MVQKFISLPQVSLVAIIMSVLKKDLYTLIQPLLPRLHSLAMCLIPDDLQAQQLVIDSFTQILLKEKESWLNREWPLDDKKQQIGLRKTFIKSMVRALVDLGIKRTAQLHTAYEGSDFKQFYQMDTRTRAVAWLRFNQSWPLDEIERTLAMKRHEVIEKVHNARFILMGQPPHWMPSETRL
jgi:hypothetical protein